MPSKSNQILHIDAGHIHTGPSPLSRRIFTISYGFRHTQPQFIQSKYIFVCAKLAPCIFERMIEFLILHLILH